jgi:hypothetical protein
MSVRIELARVDRTYAPGERLAGVVVIETGADGLSHNVRGGEAALRAALCARTRALACPGPRRARPAPRTQGVTLMATGSMYPSAEAASVVALKPIALMDMKMALAEGGKLPAGAVELPFEVPVRAVDGVALRESYVGRYLQTAYSLSVEVSCGFLRRNLSAACEFFVELPAAGAPRDAVPRVFEITPASVRNADGSALPPCSIRGVLDQTRCRLDVPFTGSVTVERSDAVVRSLYLQLVRVETLGSGAGALTSASEVLCVQLADGDVARGLAIPVHLVLPRRYVCPSVDADGLAISFKAHLQVRFAGGYMIEEQFPLELYR